MVCLLRQGAKQSWQVVYILSLRHICANIVKIAGEVRQRRLPSLKVSSCQDRDEDQDGKLP